MKLQNPRPSPEQPLLILMVGSEGNLVLGPVTDLYEISVTTLFQCWLESGKAGLS